MPKARFTRIDAVTFPFAQPNSLCFTHLASVDHKCIGGGWVQAALPAAARGTRNYLRAIVLQPALTRVAARTLI
jgi:hypothetical protein